MLQEDLDGLRQGVATLMRRKRRPRRVCIRKNHAEELEIPFSGDVQAVSKFELFGEPYQLVWVKLGDLLQALKGKVGEELKLSTWDENSAIASIHRGDQERQSTLRDRSG